MRSIQRIRRRDLLGASAVAGAAALALPTIAQARSPNEKLSIAGIGVGGQGGWDIDNCAGENIVALCDVDDRRCESTVQKFPKAKRYRDFRKMLDEMGHQIDAVVVGTPDHVHAPASAMAMRMGKHCYCEKPLTHTVYEARVLSQIAYEKKLATQMGTQIHAGTNYRRVWSWSGRVPSARSAKSTCGSERNSMGQPSRSVPSSPTLPKKRCRCPARSTGTCGSALPRSGRIVPPTCRSNGATGGRSATARWAISLPFLRPSFLGAGIAASPDG